MRTGEVGANPARPRSRCIPRFLAIIFVLAGTRMWAAPEVKQTGPDLYAYISDNDSSANSTFLVGSKGILVVDTGLDATEGAKLLTGNSQSFGPARAVHRQHALSSRPSGRELNGGAVCGSDQHRLDPGTHAWR